MTTTQSTAQMQTHLQPGIASAYMRRMIVQTLHRRGAEGAEAGAIAEMERLLEHHVQHLFASARDFAALANRSMPTAVDVLQAHHETSHTAKKLKRESKRRRRTMKLELVPEPPEETIADTVSSLSEAMKDLPRADDSGVVLPGYKERKLEYAFDGAPKIPPSWTYPSPAKTLEDTTVIKVTSAALNFVKTTVAEADIDPELGVVDYRSRGKKARR